jgi:hypothetical protein
LSAVRLGVEADPFYADKLLGSFEFVKRKAKQDLSSVHFVVDFVSNNHFLIIFVFCWKIFIIQLQLEELLSILLITGFLLFVENMKMMLLIRFTPLPFFHSTMTYQMSQLAVLLRYLNVS